MDDCLIDLCLEIFVHAFIAEDNLVPFQPGSVDSGPDIWEAVAIGRKDGAEVSELGGLLQIYTVDTNGITGLGGGHFPCACRC